MSDLYRTTDLATAGWLLTQKLNFSGLQPKDGRSYWFMFSPAKKAEVFANIFTSGNAIGNIRDYADSLRRAKDLVFEYERSGKLASMK